MPPPETLPPDYFCPNPGLECPGRGADLLEVREEILDFEGHAVGVVIFMACRLCGYRWDRS